MESARTIKFPTTGIFDFERLITSEKGKYVDKTALLYEMCRDADQQLFISRPRRFGKSLTVSALKALFSARRELFEGLSSHENFANEVLTPIAWRRRISQLEGDINEKAV